MSRTAQVLSGTKPIAFTTQLPLTFRGGAPIPNIALNFTGKPGVDRQNAALIQAMYQGQDLAPAVAQGFAVQNEVYQAISGEMMAANRNAVTAKGFELSAQRIGLLMQDKFNLGFVDVGGWDTHVNQGGADGYLANRIGELGRGLGGAARRAGRQLERHDRDRGQRVRPHLPREWRPGHRSRPWQRLLGAGRRRARAAASRAAGTVSEANLFQNRDWPVLTDYRALIGGILRRSYGLSRRNWRRYSRRPRRRIWRWFSAASASA